MSLALNPYREWLGVESSGETPNYYELLGLVPLEHDMGKINAAYQRQSGKLTARLSGSEGELAQRLMGELAEARMTLMTPTAKRAYDQALATRVQPVAALVAPALAAHAAANVDDMLPPTAAPQSTSSNAVATPTAGAGQSPSYAAAAQPYAPVYGPAQRYTAAPVYGAPQGYPATQGYPAQAYPGWPAQPAAAMGGYPTAGYYSAPQPATDFAPAAATEPTAMPVVRRRPTRRRSSGMPALIAVAVVVSAVIGGMWFYFKGGKTVAVIKANQDQIVSDSSTAKSSDEEPRAKPADQNNRDPRASKPDAADSQIRPDAGSTTVKPTTDADGPDANTEKPAMEKPTPDKSPSDPDKPLPDKPEPEKPKKEEPKRPETKAGPEEVGAVGKILKSARAALANRDLSKAQDLLAEATIEATASDTLAEVSRVETLASYVEMFWDAARKTLPKLQAAETIEIDGAMLAVVEADENHLVVRVEGKNKEFPWQKIPTKLAYYLANRWLAPDEPLRNLVLAAFEIVDPKGDLNQAQGLLDNASAAKLKVDPLTEELTAAEGR